MEKLLTRKEAATRLGMSVRTFIRHKARLKAQGLQEVCVGGWPKFREASLDRLIKQAAENQN